MTALTWALRLVIFSLLVLFSLQNSDPVNLHFLPELFWQAPLIIVLLVFFAFGAVAGVLALLGTIYRLRREIARLKRLADQAGKTVVPELPPIV